MNGACCAARRQPLLLSPAGWLGALLCCLLLTMPGCSGCQKSGQTAKSKKQQQEEEKKKKQEKEKKKPKPNFEMSRMQVEPADGAMVLNFTKPGHWVTTQQVMRANNFDFYADLHSETQASNEAITIEHTPYQLEMTRPAQLPKGQARFVEAVYPVPWFTGSRRAVQFRNSLFRHRSGQEVAGRTTPVSRMMEYQFFFVVLAGNPDDFGYVKLLDSVDPPIVDEENGNREVQYYRVVAPRIEKRVPVPSHPLTWTSVSYVLWDRLHPDLMTPQQQQALIDWLHWGGQLIVNGPDNLDTLSKGFLAEYLPADQVEATELTAQDFAELNQNWSLRSEKRRRTMTLDILDDASMVGVKMSLRPGASFVPGTGGLVAERRVGAGRVVTTAFSLGSRHFKRWGSLDNFFNGVLLRRPGRQFSQDEMLLPNVQWNRFPRHTLDPRLLSTIRYFTRDIPDESTEGVVRSSSAPDDWHFGGYASWRDAGVAGWNDRSGASRAARQALKEAAGITVPEAKFVLQAVTLYLLVLVPLNWGFFRLIGKVEWAWLAAPLIAVVGSVFVVRHAQLDIGFVRSLTQTGVLELQEGYPRGHLTRYTALYTSLSTSYELTMDDSTSLAMPFSASLDFQLRLHDTVHKATLHRADKVTLGGFRVPSNTTGMVHSEEMYALDGSVDLLGDEQQGWSLGNGTQLELRDATVLRRSESGQLEAAFVGDLAAANKRPLSFEPVADEQGPLPQWARSEALSESSSFSGNLSLSKMAQLATRSLRLPEGEFRLIAWTDKPLQGMSTSPQPAQSRHATLVLAHLRRAPLPAPQRDNRLKIDFTDEDERVITDLEESEQPAEAERVELPPIE